MNDSHVLQPRVVVPLIITLSIISGVVWGIFNKPADLIDDAYQYAAIAGNIAEKGFWGMDGLSPTMLREPFYPFFLSIFSLLFKNIITPVVIAQTLLFAILCLIIYYLLSLFNKKIAVISASLAALAPPLAYFTGQILTEILFTFLLVISVLLLITGLQKQDWRMVAGAGLLCGLAILTRSIILLFPLFLLTASLVFFRNYLKQILLFLIAAYLTVLPWSIRNFYHFNTFSPTAGGSHLLFVRALRTEYNLEQTKRYIYYATLGSSAAFEQNTVYGKEAQELFAFKTAREWTDRWRLQGYSEGDIDKLQLKKALEKIKKHPFIYLAHNPLEIIKLNAAPVSIFSTRLPARIAIHIFITMLYLLLYVCGIIIVIKILRYPKHQFKILALIIGTFIIYYNLFISFFDAIPRYNVPLLPFYLILFSIWLTERFWQHSRVSE